MLVHHLRLDDVAVGVHRLQPLGGLREIEQQRFVLVLEEKARRCADTGSVLLRGTRNVTLYRRAATRAARDSASEAAMPSAGGCSVRRLSRKYAV